MDTESITNVLFKEPDYIKAWNIVLWLNFNHQEHGNLFSIVDGEGADFYVVSQDVLKRFINPIKVEFDPNYEGLAPVVIDHIRSDPHPLEHWQEILDMFSVMDGDILRFIISHHIPLEKFIRHELGARGYDENGHWIGFDKAKKLWTTE